jgi:hypothetical protein
MLPDKNFLIFSNVHFTEMFGENITYIWYDIFVAIA